MREFSAEQLTVINLLFEGVKQKPQQVVVLGLDNTICSVSIHRSSTYDSQHIMRISANAQQLFLRVFHKNSSVFHVNFHSFSNNNKQDMEGDTHPPQAAQFLSFSALKRQHFASPASARKPLSVASAEMHTQRCGKAVFHFPGVHPPCYGRVRFCLAYTDLKTRDTRPFRPTRRCTRPRIQSAQP